MTAIGLAAAALGIAAPAAGAEDRITPVLARAIAPPQPVLADDGMRHLAYELELTNVSSSSATVQRIEALDGGRVVQSLQGAGLAAVMKPFNGDPPGVTLGPGVSAFVLMDVVLPRSAPLPRRLVHDMTISLDPPQSVPATNYLTAPTRVVRRPAVLVAPPLRGPNWVVANGCCATMTSHRGAVLPANGALHAPERFAIDFVQITGAGVMFTGPEASLSSYPFFGDGIYSVSAGRVVAKVDGMPEGTPPNPPPGITAATAGGNHVVVAMGHGRFAFYAHLQAGSMPVKVGDRVRVGQRLGSLGNTGNSTAPHLHFHIMDTPSPLGSSGLPFRFTRFNVRGTLVDDEPLFAGTPVTPVPPPGGEHRGELPLDRQVIDFAGG